MKRKHKQSLQREEEERELAPSYLANLTIGGMIQNQLRKVRRTRKEEQWNFKPCH